MKNISVGRVIDLFQSYLSDAGSISSQRTYASYLRTLRRDLGTRRIADLTPALVHKWVSRHYGEHAPSTKHIAGRTAKQLVNWAVDENLIDRSPLRKFTPHPDSAREIVLSGPQYAALVKATEGPLRDVIKFLWHTGARPQELRAIEAAWIKDKKVVFPQLDSKGKKKRRVIYLDNMAAGIAARLSAKHPEGPIFRRPQGDPWGKQELCNAIRPLRAAVGVDVVAYTLRHTWITRLLERGTPVATVAALAGNSVAMIIKHYAHIADNESHLREHLERCG